ncbi:MAG: hypothetical protein PHS93_07160 [Candidatus Omnitrophica bacterium]|nr:hypothetical protein [Candidatus Omnitrophota bacterium]MDD5352920.1 hypothetical protein [Candidatus Omnitrophota bacterium]MDD5550519.1 hypothetical protein [Candidatus Omnitrophota bacterium]
MSDDKSQVKWYFKTYGLVVAFLCVGPFMLPLVWFNPNFSTRKKIIITAIIIAISYILWLMLKYSLNFFDSSYQQLLQQM